MQRADCWTGRPLLPQKEAIPIVAQTDTVTTPTDATPPHQRDWLDYGAAAAIIGCTRRLVENAVRSGQLPAYRVGGAKLVRILRDDLDAWIMSQPANSRQGR